MAARIQRRANSPEHTGTRIEPPVTYQGGKGRLADAIVATMRLTPSQFSDRKFYDLCCGSGAVAIAAVNAGVSPEWIEMWDQGPWGLVWQAIGNGSFDLKVFADYCRSVPSDLKAVKPFMEKLRGELPGEHAPYRFLLLQAASFGGKPVSLKNGRWITWGFRDYWLPTATSNRRSPVNPMMPMPSTILARTERLVRMVRGIRGVCGDASKLTVGAESVVYIDPPYAGTVGYASGIDVLAVANKIVTGGTTCWVSEGRALTDDAVRLSEGRAKGGITGERKRAANEEWLSRFAPVCRG